MRRIGLVVVSGALVYACAKDSSQPGPRSSGGRAGAGAGGSAGRAQGGDSAAGEASGGRAGTNGQVAGSAGRGVNGGSSGGGRGGRGGGSGRGGASGASGTASGQGGELAGAGGEGPEAVNVPAYTSGTRLRTRVYVGSDGSRHVIGLRDTALDIDCEFANLGPGGYRCAPLERSGSYSNVFADDQCEGTAVGYQAACGTLERHVTTAPATCDGMRRLDVYDVGQAIAEPFRDNAGTCEPYGVDDPNAAWHVTSLADPSDFVEASLERAELGGGLSVVRAMAEDGASHARTLWFDGRPCSVVELTGAGYRCVPTPRLNRYTFFADDQCMTEVGYSGAFSACGAPPHLAVSRPSAGACSPGIISVVEVTPFQGMTAYRTDMNGCSAITLSPAALTRYVLGAEVDPDIMPALSRVESGSTRLREDVVRTPNGSTIEFSSGIFDTALDVTCTPERFEDGIVRCLPQAPGLAGLFADDGCTVPVFPVVPCDTSAYYAGFLPGDDCSPQVVTSLYRKGAAYSGAIYAPGENGCAEATDPGYEEFFLLTPMDFSELVTLTEELE